MTYRTKTNIKISKAILDLGTFVDDSGYIAVWMEINNETVLLCNLSVDTSQTQIDTAIAENETVTFFLRGPSTGTVYQAVYLIGYNIEDDESGSENASGSPNKVAQLSGVASFHAPNTAHYVPN